MRRKWGTEMSDMFVVIEWNEEFGQPSVADADVYDHASLNPERNAPMTKYETKLETH